MFEWCQRDFQLSDLSKWYSKQYSHLKKKKVNVSKLCDDCFHLSWKRILCIKQVTSKTYPNWSEFTKLTESTLLLNVLNKGINQWMLRMRIYVWHSIRMIHDSRLIFIKAFLRLPIQYSIHCQKQLLWQD